MNKITGYRTYFISLLIFISFNFVFSQKIIGQNYEVFSPNGEIKVSFILENDKPLYQVERFGQIVIEKSRLGFILEDGPFPASNTKIVSVNKKSFDSIWTQPWGEVKNIRNNYNELKINLIDKNSRKLSIIFKVYNYGIGFRYEIPAQSDLADFNIMDELTEFHLAGDHKAWWIKAYQSNRYEYLYRSSPLNQMDTVITPLTMETNNGLYLSIHEAALVNYSSMTLISEKNNVLKADLVPWSDGVRVKASSPMQTPWRTIQISDSPAGLITSYLILNLNEPNALGNVSWVEPCKYVGIWWAMHLEKYTWSTGPKHGATTKNAEKYIDFASKYGFGGVLVEGWNTGWDGDWVKNGENFNFIQAAPDYNLKKVANYAASKGIQLIGHNETGGAVLNYESQLDTAFKLYHSLGIKTVKTGYVNFGRSIKRFDENGKVQYETHHGQYMVRHYLKVVKEAAKNKIMIDAHEPIKATGLRRTYPNMMSREGARGQEYNAWSTDGGNPPEHLTILPFTRLLAGPMDFTPGIFDLLYPKIKPNNRVNTTLAKQLALYVVIYSPLQMAADLPENYEKNLKPFQFIRDVPVDWEETKVINAAIGDYITIVRKDRNSDDWYLGSITDENSRKFEVNLDFLSPGKTYLAEIYRDGNDADWKTNPYSIEIKKEKVNSKFKMQINLAPGGGEAVRFSIVNK